MNLYPLSTWRWNEPRSLARNENDPFAALQREMNQLFHSFFDDTGLKLAQGTSTGLLIPKLDISETDKEWHITVELPGVKESDIDVEFTGDALRIRGEKKDEREEKQHNLHRVERSFGMFERIIPVNAEVDRKNVHATFTNGVLQVTLPKTAATPVTQKVPVKTAS